MGPPGPGAGPPLGPVPGPGVTEGAGDWAGASGSLAQANKTRRGRLGSIQLRFRMAQGYHGPRVGIAGRVLLDPKNGPEHDLPPPSTPPQAYVVASLPRTGSTLLCDALWATGLAGAPQEHLNPMQRRDWALRAGRWRYALIRGPLLALLARRGMTPAELQAHLDRVRAARSSGGRYGLKLHAHHLLQHVPHGDLEPFLGPIRWIYVTRDDKLSQAISWARAQQTGAWASWQRPDLPPVYSRRRILRCLAQIQEGEATWEAHFAARGLTPLRLSYEQITADLPGAARSALAWLGVPGAEAAEVPPPRLQRQADGVSAAWRARFEAGG